MRMAEFTRSASDSATVLSMVAKRIASRLAGRPGAKARDCTTAVCRYRLCGITVAPRMPMAM